LWPDTSFSTVVDVTGKHDEGRVALDREFDQGIEGIQGGILESLSHEGRHLPDALERRVQV
jgi:hypothetical protein